MCSKLQPILVDLFGSTASFTGAPKHQHKLSNLLDLWEEKDYYSSEYINKLRETVKNAAEAGNHVEGAKTTGDEVQGTSIKTTKSAPYVMPATHGDSSTPWYDLPAGNLMPHIVPNSTRPIKPDMIKPLQFVAGPADPALVTAVQSLLDDVKNMFNGEVDLDERRHSDIDELGQPILLDEITGDVIEGEGYYGWSRSFCEKMKRRRKGLDQPIEDRDRDDRSRSSTPVRRKRRYSDSNDSDSGSYRASHRRREYSSSRSQSPVGRRSMKQGIERSHSPSRSRTYSRSRSPDGPRQAGGRSFQPSSDRHEGFHRTSLTSLSPKHYSQVALILLSRLFHHLLLTHYILVKDNNSTEHGLYLHLLRSQTASGRRRRRLLLIVALEIFNSKVGSLLLHHHRQEDGHRKRSTEVGKDGTMLEEVELAIAAGVGHDSQ